MKPKCPLHRVVLLLALSTLSHQLSTSWAQTTAFTFNGRLNDAGLPANGNYDIVFSLFDSDVGNGSVHPPITNSPVAMVNGLFTARIDFGDGVFTGPPRWLEVSVRPVGTPNHTVLTPRIELTSSPYAIRAREAASLPSGALTATQLHVAGAPPTAGQVLSFNGTDLFWGGGGGGGGIWSLNGSSAFYNGGSVGIGRSDPSGKLHVQGDWDGEQGALQLAGHRPTLRFTGDADSGNQSWMVHLGGDGPGNLEFFRRAGPATWNLIMDLMRTNVLFPPPTELEFGQGLRQMLNLWGNLFGIGVQNNAFYERTGGEFVWYYGGAHSDTFLNGGGGQLLLRLNTTGLITDRSVYFQSGTRQMLNLFNTTYGIGVQPSTMYFRTDNNSSGEGFAWYKGGTHTDNTADPGPNGVKLMTLTSAGLNVTAAASVCSLTIRGGCDLAEPFPMKEEGIEKGSVVVIDEEHPGQLKLSTQAYDTRVAGIVSGANGVNPGIALKQEGTLDLGENVALTGRVYVHADASFGPIKPGDLLTTSETPGHAMRVSEPARAQGAILGKAMSRLDAGKGMVLVLVTLQ